MHSKHQFRSVTMTVKIDLKEIERRANHAAFQDGLMEIFMGLFLIFFGGGISTKGTIVPFIVFTIFFANPILKRIKERYIYPRVGYVKLPQEEDTDTKGIGIAAVIFIVFLLSSLGFTIWIMGTDAGMDFWKTYILPPSTGFMMAIGPFWLGQTYGLVRGYIFALLFLLLGIVMPVFGIASGYEAVGLICTIVGVIILTTGIILFTRFLRIHPAVEGEIIYDEG
jgi:hypothetical protein